MTDIPI